MPIKNELLTYLLLNIISNHWSYWAYWTFYVEIMPKTLNTKKSLNYMEKEELRNVIKSRLNYRLEEDYLNSKEKMVVYDGFNMVGGDDDYSNLELLSRFGDLFSLDNVVGDESVIIPMFHKGSGNIVKIGNNGEIKMMSDEHDLGGWTTEEIIFRIVKLQNPNILK